jgi:plasmid maintenance system antidote protein VapI
LSAYEVDTAISFSAVKMALYERSLSIAKIAKAIGVSPSHLTNMLQKRRALTPEVEANVIALLKSAEPVQRRLF